MAPQGTATPRARPVQARRSTAEDRTERQSYWFYHQRYGDQATIYIPVDPGQTADHWPNIPALLTSDVAYTVLGFSRAPTEL